MEMYDEETPVNLDEYVALIEELDYSFRKLHGQVIITNNQTEESINVPLNSLTTKYRDYLASCVTTLELTEKESEMYRFQPKALSLKVYNTTEFWSDLLELNGCTSIIDFKPTIVKLYDPKDLKELLNEIMILEEQ
jgi:hypothetical protein